MLIPSGRLGGTGKRQEEYEERRALETTELFVAMTRARDGLFLLCGDEPCDAIYEGLEHIDEVAV